MRNKRDISTNKSGIWSRITPVVFRTLTWVGMVLIWSVIISFVLDMPNEASLRKTNDEKRDAYDNLVERYDSLAMVLENVTARDENVFRKLFESNPYDLNTSYSNERHELHRELIDLSDDELLDMLDGYLMSADRKREKLLKSYDDLSYAITTTTLSDDCIPSIQPVNNKQLTLLAAGKKPLINPFHRTMREHHGVDYLVPEGTAVFATADGVVKSLSEKNSTHGKAITIDHGNGYETSYSHLLDIRVKKGSQVKRGDIIASSGNSGLSFVPHLHYEVIYRDTRVDPVHYFFMELSPEEYQRIIRIALSSMQSFD
ncbi:MAG: M23 family metallopeptidase [Alistipes sp.]|nr:M23 family metallopeptidase [Alistipes sp.]MBR3892917.1 M23 family metallopeptidase [Alistipes sp.]MBR6630478.1 M23 family metallopeptidase [Alistipes sp.]